MNDLDVIKQYMFLVNVYRNDFSKGFTLEENLECYKQLCLISGLQDKKNFYAYLNLYISKNFYATFNSLAESEFLDIVMTLPWFDFKEYINLIVESNYRLLMIASIKKMDREDLKKVYSVLINEEESMISLLLEKNKNVNLEDLTEYVISTNNEKLMCDYAIRVDLPNYDSLTSEIIKKDSLKEAFRLAKMQPRANIKLLSKYFISKKKSKYLYKFAQECSGYDIDELVNEIIKLKSPEYIYLFAAHIKGANISLLAHSISLSGNIEYIFKFIKDVKGLESLLCDSNVNYKTFLLNKSISIFENSKSSFERSNAEKFIVRIITEVSGVDKSEFINLLISNNSRECIKNLLTALCQYNITVTLNDDELDAIINYLEIEEDYETIYFIFRNFRNIDINRSISIMSHSTDADLIINFIMYIRAYKPDITLLVDSLLALEDCNAIYKFICCRDFYKLPLGYEEKVINTFLRIGNSNLVNEVYSSGDENIKELVILYLLKNKLEEEFISSFKCNAELDSCMLYFKVVVNYEASLEVNDENAIELSKLYRIKKELLAFIELIENGQLQKQTSMICPSNTTLIDIVKAFENVGNNLEKSTDIPCERKLKLDMSEE